MHYIIVLFFPLLLLSAPFKVASYNVENLFDASVQGTEYDEFIPGKHNWSKRMMEIKLNRTAEVICMLNADILGLQEIENAFVFEALIKRLKRVGCPYRYSAITHKKGSSVQVALLSRFPLKKKKDLEVSYASPRVRNILEAEVSIDNVPLTLFVNHWKSKSRKGYESKRIQYAKTLAKRIERLPKEKEYLIVGDLNSNYNAYFTLQQKLDDAQGKTGIADYLKTVQNQELVDKFDIVGADRGVHFNPWQELPYKERWSHKFYGNKSTLDHILLPASLFDGKGIDYVNNSFAVFKHEKLFTKKGYINTWQFRGGRHLGKGYSDHLPVYAYFDTKPYAASGKKQKKVLLDKKIDYLYRVESLEYPVMLRNAVVVLKRGKYAVVKQTAEGRGIFFYGAVHGLKEGKMYDLKVQEISSYKGLKEVTAMVKVKEKGEVDLSAFYQHLAIHRQNEVLHEFTAVYKNRHLIVEGEKIPVYFKNRKLTPKNGTKLKIHYAHLGYYKKLQLVIYRKKDFEILEN